MLVIRLQRIGKKHQPSYRVVAAEKRSKLGGPPVEDLGSYNPFTKKAAFKNERISHWLKVGAKPTATVHNLFIKHGTTKGSKIKISIKHKLVSPETASTSAEPAVEAPVEPAAQTETV